MSMILIYRFSKYLDFIFNKDFIVENVYFVGKNFHEGLRVFCYLGRNRNLTSAHNHFKAADRSTKMFLNL